CTYVALETNPSPSPPTPFLLPSSLSLLTTIFPIMKIPQRRKWLPTPAFLPEKSHGQRNLAGYSPWGWKESDTTERLSVEKRQSAKAERGE
ncbi:unnamed protein product, partial [Rangifer tarandus platyrhynchus]